MKEHLLALICSSCKLLHTEYLESLCRDVGLSSICEFPHIDNLAQF